MIKKICDCGVLVQERRHRASNPQRHFVTFPLPSFATIRAYRNPPIRFGFEATCGILRNFVTPGTVAA